MRLSHRAVATSALAVVLAGGAFAPAVADADDKGGRGDKGRSEQRERREGRSERAEGRSNASSAQRAARQDERAKKPKPKPANEPRGGTQDPAGNNGTFKVDGPPYDSGMDNEPHVTCEFRLLFFGFDEGQTGDITIAGQAPSGSGVVDQRNDVLLSDDPAGGGPNDPDAVVSYSLSDLDLSGLTAHDKHGYHLKVTVETGEPGGVKHKVFWLEPCGTDTGGETGAVGGINRGTAGGSGDEASVGAVGAERSAEEGRASVLGVRLDRDENARRGGADVLGVSLSRGPLAFTGSFTEALLAAAAALLALGTGTLWMASRRPRGRHAA